MRRTAMLALTLLMLLALCACGSERTQPAAENRSASAETADTVPADTSDAETAESGEAEAAGGFTPDTRIWDVIGDPAFAGFGRLLFPDFEISDSLPIKEVYMLLPSYHCINAENTAEVLNALKGWAADGRQIFFELYSDEEKAADPGKAATGLFYFPGEPGGGLAILSPGQAFKYIGAIHDSFPHALELSKQGYHAFVVIYRPGAKTGCEDLARAMDVVFGMAEELGIDTEGYSLWGASSGGRLATWVCEKGSTAFGGAAHPKPAAVIMQYCAIWDVSAEDAPTYVNVGRRDKFTIVNIPMRAAKLEAMGIDSQVEIFEDCMHGFGLGIGTSAEGWIDRAIAFWEAQRTN